ncbi:hypothetical protein GCM10022395_08060 [Snuella lapsa]|uniref:Uncharacterized protein n=2 Tax=Snuella lapsa TaxID=870481 RepID=A0ABP6X0L7_9FLAO
MDLKNTETFLKMFDYKYEIHNQILIVNLNFSQKVLIDVSDPKNPVFTHRLTAWNFLSGMVSTSVKRALFFYLIIGSTWSTYLAVYKQETGIYVLFAIMLWGILWSLFYFHKFQNLKDFLVNWKN